MPEESLQIVENRREVEGKGERETYTKLNAQFQGMTWRDKKAFLKERCKEIEERKRED